MFKLTREKYTGLHSLKYIVKNTKCIIHGFDSDIVLSTIFLVKNAQYALVNDTCYKFPSEKYTIGENLTLVKNARYSKVISVKYNSHFYQEKVRVHS